MTLTAIERRWTHQIFDAMYPAGTDPKLPYGARDCDIDGYLDDALGAWPRLSVLGFRATVIAIALASIFVLRTFRTFDRLTVDERVKVLTRLYASKIYMLRQLVILLKASAGIAYGSAPKVRQHLLHGATEGRALYGTSQIAKGA